MGNNPLDAETLLKSILRLLPRSTSSPLPHPTDAVAALIHAIHIALDFRVVGETTSTGNQSARQEDQDVDDGASDTATAVDHEEEATSVQGQLAEGWNARGEDAYKFEYRHEQSSMVFRVRIGRMGGRIQIDATAEVSCPLIGYWTCS
jgi:hypothetical protein